MNKENVLHALNHVYDPDRPDKSVVELGMVSDAGITIAPGTVTITYCMRAPFCPYSAALGLLMKRAVEQLDRVDVKVRIDDNHYQAEVVNDILSDKAKSNELARKMEESGLFARCLRP